MILFLFKIYIGDTPLEKILDTPPGSAIYTYNIQDRSHNKHVFILCARHRLRPIAILCNVYTYLHIVSRVFHYFFLIFRRTTNRITNNNNIITPIYRYYTYNIIHIIHVVLSLPDRT